MYAKSAVSFRGFDIGLYPYEHPGCFNLLWQKIDKVHSISDDLYQRAIDLGLDPKIPLEIITPAIDTDFFRSNTKGNLHIPLRILTVGRITWKKGYEYALKTLSLLHDKQINFEYHIVGEGHYREAIVYAIHQLQLTENVKLIGQIPPYEVKNEMEWADIYIQPSIQEGFCNAVLEAQAMGLLCIVTDAEGLSENVLHGKTGWVVNKRNPKLIVKVIQQILKMDRKKLRGIGDFAKKRINNEFNLRNQAELFRKFYCNNFI
jgi:colanic acid/amylovoran biosynthesis glycosyltransferase